MKIVHFFSYDSTLHLQVRSHYHFRAIRSLSDGRTFLGSMDVLLAAPYNEKSTI
jgi:hypothetical protein